MRVRSVLGTLLALAAVLGGTNRPATAQSACPSTAGGYTPGAASLSLSATQVAPGDSLVVSGRCCAAMSTVTIEFRSAPESLGTVQTDRDGSFTTTVVIPADATPGQHSIVATGAGCNVSAAVNVLGATLERDPDARLPKTGGPSTIPFGIAGVLLVVVGMLTVLATRRKRTAAATP